MGKTTGYLEFDRKEPGYRKRGERVRDYQPVEKRLSVDSIKKQAARCMDCGTPFCFSMGCPLGNIIPEFNDMVFRERWEDALNLLLEKNCFPEFTSAICPAPCETACILNINDDAVTIRQIEKEIIEMGFNKGFVQPEPPAERIDRSVAVVGSGPAGLTVAQTLNRAGCNVTVFEKEQRVGGLLRYGIPDFKFDKSILDRRITLMSAEGVVFESGTSVGNDISLEYLNRRFDAVCLCGGAMRPRDLQVPGRNLKGVYFAMDFLVQQNKLLLGEDIKGELITAKDRKVVIIGGGDTGSDCLGTALRQGAKEVHQFEIMPEPPCKRAESNPWPEWPNIRRTSSSHKEGGVRKWSVSTVKFTGDDKEHLTGIHCKEVAWEKSHGRMVFEVLEGTEFDVAADMALLAMGFTGLNDDVLEGMELKRDPHDGIWTDEQRMTSMDGIFSAGDMRIGQSLVVRAIADGQAAAKDILLYLQRSK